MLKMYTHVGVRIYNTRYAASHLVIIMFKLINSKEVKKVCGNANIQKSFRIRQDLIAFLCV